MRRSTRRSIYWVFHYILIACFLTIALFPLFWVFKVSVTPNDLLYTEGVRLWPSRFNFEHYASVISHTNLPALFPQQPDHRDGDGDLHHADCRGRGL